MSIRDDERAIPPMCCGSCDVIAPNRRIVVRVLALHLFDL